MAPHGHQYDTHSRSGGRGSLHGGHHTRENAAHPDDDRRQLTHAPHVPRSINSRRDRAGSTPSGQPVGMENFQPSGVPLNHRHRSIAWTDSTNDAHPPVEQFRNLGVHDGRNTVNLQETPPYGLNYPQRTQSDELQQGPLRLPTGSIETHSSRQYPHGADARENSARHTRRAASVTSRGSILDARYQVQLAAWDFFAEGRVFKIFWPTTAGMDAEGRPSEATQDVDRQFGEPLHTGIRWMLVVKRKSGHCICVPITSYSKQGLAGKTLSAADVRAHAIVYQHPGQPEVVSGEPEMKLEPIPVILRSDGAVRSIAPSSRVHFGKLHTVEYNYRVMDVGMVHNRYIAYVVWCAQQQFS